MNTNNVLNKLIAEIERRKNRTEHRLDNIIPLKRKDTIDEEQLVKIELLDKVDKSYLNGVWITLIDILSFITSLQQEQPKQQNGKFVFPKYLYARTKDNKTIDMSYAPQDMTAIEYIRNDFVEQEQPEVELEKEVDMWQSEHLDFRGVAQTARHFAEWGAIYLNARKK